MRLSEPGRQALRKEGNDINILLVEDNSSVREVLGALLTALGHAVVPADGGRDALDYLDAGSPIDLVLTDLRMPDPDGRQVIQTTKARWPTLPVGVITGSPELLEGQPEPADFMLAKPVGFDTLRETLGALTAGYRYGVSQTPSSFKAVQ